MPNARRPGGKRDLLGSDTLTQRRARKLREGGFVKEEEISDRDLRRGRRLGKEKELWEVALFGCNMERKRRSGLRS